MSFFRKKIIPKPYDKENKKPMIKASICNGEQVAGFKDIRTGKTRQHDAFVYIMHEDRKLGTPTEAYMRTCLEGYRDFGFDSAFLLAAYARSL